MAVAFKNVKSRNIGAALTAIGSYTVGASKTATIVALTVANTTASSTITIAVTIYDSSNDYYICKNLILLPGETLPVSGVDRHVLNTGESVRVISDTATSCDAILSVLEQSV